MNTIAVGPFLLVESWVTGGTGVAKLLTWFALFRCHNDDVGVNVSLLMVD